MFVIYEYATIVLVASIGMTLLFTACVMFLVFKERCTILVQTLRKLTHGATGLMGRWATEPREP